MPQIPYSGSPQVSPQTPATPYVHEDAPLAAFGGASAQATEHLGQTEQHSANELFARAISLQEMDQQAKAITASSGLADHIGDLEVKFRSLSGQAAVNGYGDFKSNVLKAQQQFGNELESPYARLAYLRDSRNMTNGVLYRAGIHAGDQQRKYLGETIDSIISAKTRLVGSTPDSDDVYKSAIAEVDSHKDLYKQLSGGDDITTANWAANRKSEIVSQRAQALAVENPGAAKKFLDEASKQGLVTGDVAIRIGTYIRNQQITVGSRVEAAKILNGGVFAFGDRKVGIDRLMKAVRQTESGENYDIIREIKHRNGTSDRAVGAYQILESNLPSWLEEARMSSMSAEKFAYDHEAQDQLARFKLGQMQDRTDKTTANNVVTEWFTGRPNASLTERDQDTNLANHLKIFNGYLGRTASANDLDQISKSHAEKISPGNDEFAIALRDRVIQENGRNKQLELEDRKTRNGLILSGLQPDPVSGKLPISVDDIKDPEARDALMKLPATDPDKIKFMDHLRKNSVGGYVLNEQTQRIYDTWLGKLIDPRATDEDRREALEADMSLLPIPHNLVQKLQRQQIDVFKQTQKNPAVDHAMKMIHNNFGDVVPDKKSGDDYNLFWGELHRILSDKIQETGKPLKDEEILKVGAEMLRQERYRGFFKYSTTERYHVPVPDSAKQEIIKKFQQENEGDMPEDLQIQQIYSVGLYNKAVQKLKIYPKKALDMGPAKNDR